MGEKELRQAFVAALPDRVVGLEMAYESWCVAPPQERGKALEELLRLSHNLAGACALYGFEQMSAPCRVLECYIRGVMRNGESHGDDCGTECLGHLVAAVRCVVRQVNNC